ncbi:MAG: threonylcarbamoyl-AMP synthase [Clostridiales bacterium]|jgi:L-threonylcarbamoyladenylate synthase|nr:threonylcarbamoyl-AMP synthase [Clostridiales bacterium]
MNTKITKIDRYNFKIEDLSEAAKILKKGGLVAFPTETVYGLGADGLNPEASKKIYEAKGRPSDNPLILHISSLSALDVLTKSTSSKGLELAKKFWPGPLTLIFDKSEIVPYSTTGGLETIAIRMPSHPVAYELIRLSGVYVAAPSANTSGRPSPTNAQHVIDDLEGKIDYIIDSGKVDIGLESTIIDVTEDIPTILRPGYITRSMIEKVVGPVNVDRALISKSYDPNIVARAPGMKYKHYAPKGELIIFEGEMDKVIRRINEITKDKIDEGYKVGIIATDETIGAYKEGDIKTIGTRKDEDTIARGLFEILREFDNDGVDYIFTESFDDNKLGQAIMNRLLKAAGYRVVNVID